MSHFFLLLIMKKLKRRGERLPKLILYIPPDCNEALTIIINNLSEIMDSAPNDKFLICGDFNLPLLQ